MPIISMFFGIVIRLNVNDHHPPHIHAHYGDDEACFDIQSGDVTAGKLPPRQTRFVQTWIDIHQEDLMADWQIAKAQGEVFRIDPLK